MCRGGSGRMGEGVIRSAAALIVLGAGAGLGGGCLAAPLPAPPVFVNELHYDDAGADEGEGIEVAGPLGFLLDGWRIELYNGANGLPYRSVGLSGPLQGAPPGPGVRAFLIPAIQNGAPDGLALVDPAGAVAEFLVYEGALVGMGGAAAGLQASELPVSEDGRDPPGRSLQRTGQASHPSGFRWRIAPDSFGRANEGQVLLPAGMPPPVRPVPEPSPMGLALWGVVAALGGRLATRRSREYAGVRGGSRTMPPGRPGPAR